MAAEHPDDIWLARSHVAEVLAWNPAPRFGLLRKGDIAPGYDADLALLDPTRRFTVRAADSQSGQGYTPFEGQEPSGWVTTTFLRGALVYDGCRVVRPTRGRYFSRPD